MNSTARALAQASFSMEGALPFLTSRRFWLISLLAIIVLFSGLALVYTKDANRRAFIQQQQLERDRDNLHIEWGQLLLEESSWSTARIQRIAQDTLAMQVPATQQVIVVHP